MREPRKIVSGWAALAEPSDEPTNLRSPQERNLLQFSPFAGFEESPLSTKGRFRRVNTTISGSNRPARLQNLTSRQLSQMSSGDSGDGAGPSSPRAAKDAPLPVDKEHPAGSQDSSSEVDTSNKEIETSDKDGGAADSSGNGGLSNSLTISLDQSTLRGKRLTPSGRTVEVSTAELESDMEPSQISAHSKPATSEDDSAQDIAGAEGEVSMSGKAQRRSMTAKLTKALSQEGKMLRKFSGLLSRSRASSPRDSKKVPKLDGDDKTGLRDSKTEQGIPARKGSLLGLLGAKLPMRKRSFMRNPKRRAGRVRSADYDIRTEDTECVIGAAEGEEKAMLSEKDSAITAAISAFREDTGEGGITATEDELAKRAVQIENFLNNIAFL